MQPSKKLKAITGRHYGESVARDKRLSCGTSSCGDNNFKDSYDPIAHFTNCLVWDTLFYLDTTVLYGGVFDHLQQQYEIAVDSKTGSLRMGCFMCPVVAVSTLRQNVQSGILDERGFQVRELLEDLRTARRIKNQRTQKNGAIYIEDRRKYWKLLDKEYLLMNNYITTKDIAEISDRLSSDYAYPPTYKRKWIDKQHRLIK